MRKFGLALVVASALLAGCSSISQPLAAFDGLRTVDAAGNSSSHAWIVLARDLGELERSIVVTVRVGAHDVGPLGPGEQIKVKVPPGISTMTFLRKTWNSWSDTQVFAGSAAPPQSTPADLAPFKPISVDVALDPGAVAVFRVGVGSEPRQLHVWREQN